MTGLSTTRLFVILTLGGLLLPPTIMAAPPSCPSCRANIAQLSRQYRPLLPDRCIPKKYELEIEPFLSERDAFEFRAETVVQEGESYFLGGVRIFMECRDIVGEWEPRPEKAEDMDAVPEAFPVSEIAEPAAKRQRTNSFLSLSAAFKSGRSCLNSALCVQETQQRDQRRDSLRRSVQKPTEIFLHAHPEMEFEEAGINFLVLGAHADRDGADGLVTNVIPLASLTRVSSVADEQDGSSISFPEEDVVRLTFAEALPLNGHGILVISKFKGVLNEDYNGFYRHAYQPLGGVSGELRYMATTMMSETNARRAFPCFDEPHRKAVFSVSVKVGPGLQAISNMPLVAEPLAAGPLATEPLATGPLSAEAELPAAVVSAASDSKRWFRFQPTPLMSTYLLAWVVAPLRHIAARTKDGIDVRVYGVESSTFNPKKLEFPLVAAVKALEFYNDFFGSPVGEAAASAGTRPRSSAVTYPLPKLDLIAFDGLDCMAMENWGLLVYLESALYVSETASYSQKVSALRTVTHEIAHQWFGNLVTMRWWDEMYLNEGFADYMEALVADRINLQLAEQGTASGQPADIWNIRDFDSLHNNQNALVADSVRASHAIRRPVNSYAVVTQIMDDITYGKSAYVVKMLHALLGDRVFQKGLQRYMNRLKFANARTEDLIGSWQYVLDEENETPVSGSRLNLSQFLRSWLYQMGFPVLECRELFAEEEESQPSAKTVVCTQRWYLADGSVRSGDELVRWQVPIVALFSTDGETRQYRESIFDGETETKHVLVSPAAPGTNDNAWWVKLNSGQTAPVRVAYDGSLFHRLVGALRRGDPALSAKDKAGFLMDTVRLAASGHYGVEPLENVLRAARAAVEGVETNLAGRNAGRVRGMGVVSSEDTDHWTVYTAVFDVLSLSRGFLQLLPSDAANDLLKKKFQIFVRKLLQNGFERYCYFVDIEGPRAETDAENRQTEMFKSLQTLFASLPVDYGLRRGAAVEDARVRFAAFRADQNTPLLPDALKSVVFALLLNPAGPQRGKNLSGPSPSSELEEIEATFSFLLNQVIRNPSADSVHKEIARASLGNVPTHYPHLQNQIWALVHELSVDKIADPLTAFDDEPLKQQFLWENLKSDWERIELRTKTTAPGAIQGMVTSCADNFAGEEKAREIEAFFADKDSEKFADALKQTVEKTRMRGATLDRWRGAGSLDAGGSFWREVEE